MAAIDLLKIRTAEELQRDIDKGVQVPPRPIEELMALAVSYRDRKVSMLPVANKSALEYHRPYN